MQAILATQSYQLWQQSLVNQLQSIHIVIKYKNMKQTENILIGTLMRDLVPFQAIIWPTTPYNMQHIL